MITEETPMSEGAIFHTSSCYYVLHQLPTKNWVLVNELSGYVWYHTSADCIDPIDAFGGWEDEFHQA